MEPLSPISLTPLKKVTVVQDGRMIQSDVDERRFNSFEALARDATFRTLVGNVGDDGAAMAFLVSQLAFTESQVFEKKYLPMQFEQFLPVDYSAGEWADVIRYEIIDGVGQGKPTSWKSKAFNKIDVGYGQRTFPVVYGTVGYDYTQEELRRTSYLRRALPETKLAISMDAYRRHLNIVGLKGEADTGLSGLYNNPLVPTGNAPTGKWNAATGAATADQIIADMNFALTKPWESTQYNVIPNMLLLPPTAYSKISSTPRNTQTNQSILKYFLENNIVRDLTGQDNYLQVLPGYLLNDQGAGATGRAIAYHKDKEFLTMHVPLPLRFLAPQLSGLAIEVPGEYKYSGVEVRYPKSAFYMDGI